MMRRLVHLLAAVCLLAAHAPEAMGQGCTLRGTGIAFGEVSDSRDTPATTPLILDCNLATSDPMLRVCISIGAPLSGDVLQRHMAGPNRRDVMDYNLYSDAAHTQVWGSITSTVPPPAIDFPLSGGSLHTSIIVYGLVPPALREDTGLYLAPFAPTDIQVGIQSYTVAPSDCADIPIDSNISQMIFVVSARLAPNCSISAKNIDFGRLDSLESSVTAKGSVKANCPRNVPFTLAMDAGQGAGASVNNRLLTRLGGTDTISYGLYKDSSYTTIWEMAVPAPGSSATAATRTLRPSTRACRRNWPAAAQPTTPRSGTYRDSIIVTMTY